MIVETDPRLVSLFDSSYNHPALRFVATDTTQRMPLPNGGKPETAGDMKNYFDTNAAHLAKRLDIETYTWSTLLRPEIAAPFNAYTPTPGLISTPRPAYLTPNSMEWVKWSDALDKDTTPVLISWNKGFSQHGSAAQQNLDAYDVAYIIGELSNTPKAQLSFYNAVHGITPTDLNAVNDQLPQGTSLEMIIDPAKNEPFNLGTELARYTAFMSVSKARGGVMIGIGNTYQHMWYASGAGVPLEGTNHLVVLPHGEFPTKPTWELQAAQPDSPTVTISKTIDYETDRRTTLNQIVAQTRRMLRL